MTVRQLASRVEPTQRGSPQPSSPTPTPDSSRTTFAEEYRQAHERLQRSPGDVKLSAHAQERIEQRSISMTPTERQTLSDTMRQLEAKGARDALLLRSDAAFVVNVPNRTVVTALGHEDMQERIFTQIDSAALV